MLKRAVSGFVGIGLFLALCFGGTLPFALATSALALLCAGEWVVAYRHSPVSPERKAAGISVFNSALALMGAAYPICLYVGLSRHTFQPQTVDAVLLALPVVLFVLLTLRAWRTGQPLGGIRRWYGLIGAVYVGMLLGSFVLLRGLGPRWRVAPFGSEDRGAWLMLLAALCVWATDTAAYFVGRALGRHKLAPALSPKKTVEGAVGGLVGALLTGAGFGIWFHLGVRDGLALGALAGVAGQIGDLWESALKRELGIKDFGGVMPGHGGALDRFDSLLFVAPLAYLYLRCVGG